MERRALGGSDLRITPIGFGAWAIGGSGWKFAWGAQDDADSIAAIREALDLGINWIDTAAVYGLGHSEEVVAAALAGMSDKPYVFTKCGRLYDPAADAIVKCLKAESIRAECEASLKRLKVDALDLYQMHWPEPDEDVEEGWTEMVRLRDAGKVRWIGVSNFSVDQLRRVTAIEPPVSLQPPYSLIRPEIEQDVLPYCGANGVGVLAYSPMGSGLLTGAMTAERVAALPADDWRRNSMFFKEPRLSHHLRLAEELKTIGAKYRCSAGEVAVAWTLRRPEVTAAIVGARRTGQLAEIVGAAAVRLDGDDLRSLERFASPPTS
ncbi:MAG: aldo/keto reductase [Planctomycetia bacterium]